MYWITHTLYNDPELTTAISFLGYILCLGYFYVEILIWEPRVEEIRILVDHQKYLPYQMYALSKRNFKWLLWAGLFAIGTIIEGAIIIGVIALIKMI